MISKQKTVQQLLSEYNILILRSFNMHVNLVLQNNDLLVLKHSKNYDQLQKEYQLLKSLKSYNFIEVGQIFTLEQYHFFEMRYANSFTLAEYLQQVKYKNINVDEENQTSVRISKVFAKQFCWQLIMSVFQMHQANIVHCDIKLDNILMNLSPNIKNQQNSLKKQLQKQKMFELYLCDFGQANILSEQFMTMTTPSNTPPEIFNGEPWTKQSDIFQLGIVFYQLFIGDHPFQVKNTEETENNILNKQIQLQYNDIFDYGKNTKVKQQEQQQRLQIIQMINGCLQKDPTQRPTIEQLYNNNYLRICFYASLVETFKDKVYHQFQQQLFSLKFGDSQSRSHSSSSNLQIEIDNTQVQIKKKLSLTPFQRLYQQYSIIMQPRVKPDQIITRVQNADTGDCYSCTLTHMRSQDQLSYYLQIIQNQLSCQQKCQFITQIKKCWINSQILYILTDLNECSNVCQILQHLHKQQMLNQSQISQYQKRQLFNVIRKQNLIIQILIILNNIHQQQIFINKLNFYNLYSINIDIQTKQQYVKEQYAKFIDIIKMNDFNGSGLNIENILQQKTRRRCCQTQIKQLQSPAQRENIHFNDKANDIWALGCMCYFLSYNKYPFNEQQQISEDDIEEILEQIIADQFLDQFSCKIICLCFNNYQQITIQQILNHQVVNNKIQQIYNENFIQNIINQVGCENKQLQNSEEQWYLEKIKQFLIQKEQLKYYQNIVYLID